MALRNNPAGGSGDPGEIDQLAGPEVDGAAVQDADQAILDAARRLIVAHGISRTTVTEVAREAGLSRMTVYRRWTGLPQIIGATMQREWGRLLDLQPTSLAARAGERPDVRTFLVDEVVDATRTLRESELLRRILAVDPELMLPYLVLRPGAMHVAAITLIAAAIERGQADGSIREGDSRLLATAVVVTVQGWVVSLTAAGAGQSPAKMDAELRSLLDAYLRPAA